MKRDDEAVSDDQPNRYFDPHFQVETAKILPGEYYATNKDMALVTVLGSCVSACLRDQETGIGGMNHFMLPDDGKLLGSHGNVSAGGRYGVHAMELLINQILKLGGRRDRLEAKVFGGGNVLRGFQDPIGSRNARFVLDYMQAERIPVQASDLGDIHPRKVAFFVQTGRTLVRRLPATRDRELVDVERAYREQLSHRPRGGSVELF